MADNLSEFLGRTNRLDVVIGLAKDFAMLETAELRGRAVKNICSQGADYLEAIQHVAERSLSHPGDMWPSELERHLDHTVTHLSNLEAWGLEAADFEVLFKIRAVCTQVLRGQLDMTPMVHDSKHEIEQLLPSDCVTAKYAAIEPHLERLKALRNEKLTQLSAGNDEAVPRIRKLERELQNTMNLSICTFTETKFKETVTSILENSGDLANIDMKDKMIFLFPDVDKLKLYVEILLNKITNQRAYLFESSVFVRENNLRIVSELTGISVKELPPVTVVKVSFLEELSETHNGGRRPLVVQFACGGETLKCVYKPRPAYIDRTVIQTFTALNKTGGADNGYPLPTYTIVQPEQNDNWVGLHGVGEVSLWQFVEGKNVRDIFGRQEATVHDYLTDGVRCTLSALSDSALSDLERQRLEVRLAAFQRLARSLSLMARVLSFMKITDLHTENFIVTHLDEQNQPTERSELKPIDLEAMGTKTFLGTRGRKLSRTEVECCRRHFKIAPNWRKRNILLPTQVLFNKQAFFENDPIKKVNEIVDSIKKSSAGFRIELTDQEIQNCVMEDLLTNDIPVFTEIDDLLYYGVPERGILLGRKTST